MQYLDSFRLASDSDEAGFVLNYPPQLVMQCYSHNNIYPFGIFPGKRLTELSFKPVTMLYGGNGSGKSTLLNIIAEKLSLTRSAPFNNTPYMESYLKYCRYELPRGIRRVPQESRIITSDDVFDFILDIRSVNEGVDKRREELFEEYRRTRDEPLRLLDSLDGYEEFKRQLEIKNETKSQFTSKRLPRELDGKSNGESAYMYFTDKIRENALYLLDEPENSLSPKLQNELVRYIADSVRFYKCQFIISTHSPFLLSMNNAKIYDLDVTPVAEKPWTELENIRIYYDFFTEHIKDFE